MAFATVRVDDSGARSAVAQYQADVSVLTAARMSATFPFVTPMARPALVRGEKRPLRTVLAAQSQSGPSLDSASHLADGGYFDNLGMVTALEWLREFARVERKETPKIAIVTCIAFPDPKADGTTDGDDAGPSTLTSLSASFAGPLTLLGKVRTSSQIDRAQFEQDLAEDFAAAGIDVSRFVLRPPPDAAEGPLNWHLTDSQRQAIENDFDDLASEPAGDYKRLLDWFSAPD